MTQPYYEQGSLSCNQHTKGKAQLRRRQEDNPQDVLEVQGKLYNNAGWAVAAVKGIEAVKNGNGGEGGVKSLQEYHALIK